MADKRSKPKTITQPKELWIAVSEQMRREGANNLSAWIGDCMTANLDEDLKDKLPARRRPGNPYF